MTNSKKIKVFLLAMIGLLGLDTNLWAQAIHFSHFDQAGFILNPAKTGAYYGTARVGGIYRDQYRKINSQPYSTTLLYVDSPISYVGKNNKSWLGVGATAYVDKVGLAKLSTNAINLTAAYHYALDQNYKNVISIAGTAGYTSRRNNLTNAKLLFEDEINPNGSIGGQTSKDRNTFGNNVSYLDAGAGIMLKSRISEKATLTLGSGLMHLNKPSVGLGTETVSMPLRINAHASIDLSVGEKLQLTPRVLYSKMSEAQQTQIQAIVGYQIKPDFMLKGGLGTRLNDAAQLFLGAEFNRFDVGIGYDYTISDLSNSTTGGALELAVSYIFIKERNVTSTPRFICPQL